MVKGGGNSGGLSELIAIWASLTACQHAEVLKMINVFMWQVQPAPRRIYFDFEKKVYQSEEAREGNRFNF